MRTDMAAANKILQLRLESNLDSVFFDLLYKYLFDFYGSEIVRVPYSWIMVGPATLVSQYGGLLRCNVESCAKCNKRVLQEIINEFDLDWEI